MVSTSFVGVSTQVTDDTDTLETPIYGGLMNSSWPMFCHDVRHTGRSPYGPEGNVYVREKWKVPLHDIVTFSSPAIATDGTIYIGTFDGALHAILPNGTEKWMYKTPHWNADMSSPAIDENGTIYVGSQDGHLYAVYPNGTEKWSLAFGDDIYSSPAIADDGTIYIGAYDIMCAINPNGTILWEYTTGYPIKASPAIGDDGTVYVASHDGYIYAFYPRNGTVKWKIFLVSGISCYSSPAIDDNGTIYYGTRYELFAINPNGTVKWVRGGGCYYGGPVIGYDGTIYAVGGTYLRAFKNDGTEKWKYGIYGEECSPLISKNGLIYVLGGKTLFVITPEGKKISTLYFGYDITSSPAMDSNGILYIGTWSSYLHAIESIPDEPPSKPTITGLVKSTVRQKHNYTISSTDPEQDNISYYINWGDGQITDWIGPYMSGEEIIQTHIWTKRGTYIIQVKARDGHGLESDWGTLTVTMPYEPQFPFILWLLERFPNAFPILRYLLGCYDWG